jgi:hypothetical protein
MKFREDRPFASIDAAVKKLLEIANGLEPDHSGRIHVGAINALFMTAGGDAPDYSAAVKAAIERGYMTMHPSGGHMSFTQAGADLFACSRQMGKLVAMSVAFGLNGPSWRWS